MKRNFLMRLSALAAASAMLMASVSCGGKKSSSDEEHNLVGDIDDNANLSPEDMPANVILLPESVSGVPLKMEYVEGQLTEQEAIAVTKYLCGLSTKDGEMVKSSMFGGMAEHIVSTGQAPDIQTFTDGAYNYYKDFVGEDYNVNYLIAGGLYPDMDYTYYDNIVFTTDREAKITGRKTVFMELYYDTDTKLSGAISDVAGDYVYVVVYTINGQSYVMENVALDLSEE